MKRILDISRPVRAGIPVWPGDTDYTYTLVARIRDGSSVNVGSVTMSVHTGAHVDAPCHFDDHGQDIASVDLSKCVGPCVVAVVHPKQHGILPSDLPASLDEALKRAPRLLLRTYDKRPSAFDKQMSHLTPALADHLADRGVVLVGVDTDSMDAFDSKDLPSHHRLAARGVAILEGIDLSAVAPGVYDLIALPLRLEGADASPVRAVLVTDKPEQKQNGQDGGSMNEQQASIAVEHAGLLAELNALLPALAAANVASPREAEAALAALVPTSSPRASRIEALLRVGVRDGWLLTRAAGPKVRFGRLAKDLGGFSVDAVLMEGPAAGHTHTKGEINLGFRWSGDPKFDGRPTGWVVFPPGSHHVPTVTGGEMLILYFVPGGRVVWDAPPAPPAKSP